MSGELKTEREVVSCTHRRSSKFTEELHRIDKSFKLFNSLSQTSGLVPSTLRAKSDEHSKEDVNGVVVTVVVSVVVVSVEVIVVVSVVVVGVDVMVVVVVVVAVVVVGEVVAEVDVVGVVVTEVVIWSQVNACLVCISIAIFRVLVSLSHSSKFSNCSWDMALQ